MSFDRRITPIRADLADERLRGQVEAERFTAGNAEARRRHLRRPCTAIPPATRPSIPQAI